METRNNFELKGLRDYLFKKRLNLSQKHWKSSYNTPSYNNYPECIWKSNRLSILNKNEKDKKDEISIPSSAIIIWSFINTGFLIIYLSR
jgi:hypothetical protein